ncbi:hypothetical protein [Micromonospora sp. WMMD1082]|uniref:hypothetical protein n=1 Tax=Micromonospora sp. WMMD1082 TaxID=3016104 RepID=UPI0024166FB1|nr:hypothetical protein [Micromonospora sp. WMMD1082]MDG4795187.1 hypothetical protein [Micromonospora sp. WMMD1082]
MTRLRTAVHPGNQRRGHDSTLVAHHQYLGSIGLLPRSIIVAVTLAGVLAGMTAPADAVAGGWAATPHDGVASVQILHPELGIALCGGDLVRGGSSSVTARRYRIPPDHSADSLVADAVDPDRGAEVRQEIRRDWRMLNWG